MNKYKLVMFDMDGTLLKGKGIFVIAEKLGFLDELLKFFPNPIVSPCALNILWPT